MNVRQQYHRLLWIFTLKAGLLFHGFVPAFQQDRPKTEKTIDPMDPVNPVQYINYQNITILFYNNYAKMAKT
jgi:hypothetical protein